MDLGPVLKQFPGSSFPIPQIWEHKSHGSVCNWLWRKMRCLPMWAWGRNVSMWASAQTGDYVISVRRSDHENAGLWKWSLQLEKVWNGTDVRADREQQCLTLVAWARFGIQVSETTSFLPTVGCCVVFFWEPGHKKLGISGKNSSCVDLAREDWFGQWNVDLLPARTKNPVATSKENTRELDGAANVTVRRVVQEWWFHLITSCVITGSN